MARPAASSLALLMRRPEDRRCSYVVSEACEVLRLRCEFRDEMLVLIFCAMVILQISQFGLCALHFGLPRYIETIKPLLYRVTVAASGKLVQISIFNL